VVCLDTSRISMCAHRNFTNVLPISTSHYPLEGFPDPVLNKELYALWYDYVKLATPPARGELSS
jgi:hypothetical protein